MPKTSSKAPSQKQSSSENVSVKKTSRDTEKRMKRMSSFFSYTDPLQQKFVSCIMKCGKKIVAQRVLSDTFEELVRKGEKDPVKVFESSLQNTTPTVEVRPKRIGGAVYQIPMEVPLKRQQSLAIRWILNAARSRKGQPMYRRLAVELLEASQDLGSAVNKKKEVHKMAQANKALAHLAKY